MLTAPAGLSAEQEDLVTEIDAMVERHGQSRDALIPILQELQAAHGQIEDLAMQVVANRLRMSATDVYGVVTFYSFLETRPTGRHVIRMCRNLSCQFAGKQAVAEQLERELGVPFGETTDDGLITLEWVNCIGQCDRAPAMLIDDQAYGAVTPDQVGGILADLRAIDR
jgi:NADH:ubiquinone oxidoreductase subunit E